MFSLSNGFQLSNPAGNNRPLPTSKNNPCPLCGNVSGHDRFSGEGVLCHNGLDGALAGDGWKFVKNTKDGQWGIYYLNGQEYDREKAEKIKEQRQEKERKQLQQALPIPERDKYYRQLAATLPKDRAITDLTKRGLSIEQIEKYHFFDIRGGQFVPDSFPDNFPGIRKDWKFSNGRNTFGYAVQDGNNWKDIEGYTVPCYTLNGEIAGYQIRNTQGLKPKYKWPINSKLPNGEMPLAVFMPNPEDKRLYLCDSPLKALITSAKHNVNTLGIPNGNYKAVAQQIKEVIEWQGTTRLIRAIDAGDILKEDDVMKGIKNEHPFLASFGIEVVYAWWGQRVKKVDPDIDELSNLEEVQCLAYQELLNLAKKEQWIAAQWMKWINDRKFNADINFNEPYLSRGYNLGDVPSNAAAFFKSGTGTGKTTDFLNLLKTEALKDMGAISLGYRNQLLYQFEAKGLEAESDDDKVFFYHINDSDESLHLSDPSLRILLCIHSILKIPLEKFEGKIIIVDEAVSVIKALLADKTILNRQAVIDRFFKALQVCDRAFFFDANMNDKFVNFVINRIGCKEKITVCNHFKDRRAKVKILDGIEINGELTKKNSKGRTRERILHADYPVLVCSDSAKELETLDRLFASETDKKGLLITAATVNDNPECRAFINDPDKWIKANNPDYVLYSPTIESGADINTQDYFGKHYGFFLGVLVCNEILQMMNRLRDPNCEKIMSIKSFVPNEELSQRQTNVQLLMKDVTQKFILESNLVSSGDRDMEQALSGLCSYMNQQLSDPDFIYHSEIRATENLEFSNLRKYIAELFRLHGHTVEIVTEDSESLKKEFSRIKKEIKIDHATAIYAASNKFVGKAKKTAVNAKYEDQSAIAKAVLFDRLPGLQQSPIWSVNFAKLVLCDKVKIIKGIENFFLLHNEPLARSLSKIRLNNFNEGTLIPYHWKPEYTDLKILRDIGFIEFIEKYKGGQPYSKENQDVIQLHERAKVRKRSKSKIAVEPSAVQFVNKILTLVGLQTKLEKTSDGRQYSIDTSWLNSEEFRFMLKSVGEKFNAIVSSKSNLVWTPKITKNDNIENCKKQQFENPEALQDKALVMAPLNVGLYNKTQERVPEEIDTKPSIIDPPLIVSVPVINDKDDQYNETLDKDMIEIIAFQLQRVSSPSIYEEVFNYIREENLTRYVRPAIATLDPEVVKRVSKFLNEAVD